MSTLTGTGRLTRLAFRRDRIKLTVWIVAISVLALAMSSAMLNAYSTPAERNAAAGLVAHNPGILVIRGAVSAANPGGFVMSEGTVIWGVFAAFMSLLAVIRHTRQNEETGRAELIGSTIVGRHASLAAVLIMVVGVNFVLSGLISLILVTRGLPLAGSLLAGVGIGAIGISFAVFAAVISQLFESTRRVSGWTIGILGSTYLLRGIGDAFGNIRADGATITSAWPSWMSPLGWAQQMRPFGTNNWWVLLLPGVLLVAGSSLAFVLQSRRDIGMGLWPTRPGPARAARYLLKPIGLVWKQQRGIFFGWLAAVTIFGTVFGSIGKQVADLEDTQAAQVITKLGGGGANFVDIFYAAILALFGAAVGAYVVQSLLVARSEEMEGRLEPLLATAIGRVHWLLDHVALTIFGALVILLLFGGSMGVAYGLITGELMSNIISLSGAALNMLPAILVLAGVTILAIGTLPRWAAAISWTTFTIALVAGPLGDMLGLSQRLRDISPFSHLPALPVADLALTPLLVLTVIAVIVGSTGIVFSVIAI